MASLKAVYERSAPGGVIVVDDCKPGNTFDGAYQAYCEFIGERKLTSLIVHDKLGIIDVGTG